MTITGSPADYARPLYRLLNDFDIQDYTDADAHTTDQAPDRRNILLINGHPYAPDPGYPLDYAWRKGA